MTTPVPYTLEAAADLTDRGDRVRAHAELSSYIVRLRIENGMPVGQPQVPTGPRSQTTAVSGTHVPTGPRSSTIAPFGRHVPTGPRFPTGVPTGPRFPTVASSGPRALPVALSGAHVGHGYRGGSIRGGGRGGRGGRATYHHPYQRPQQFRHNSAAFNSQDLAGNAPVHRPHQHTEPQAPCPQFTMTGLCSRQGCRSLHNPNKQAICKGWLFTGTCPMGDACPLSHCPSPNNAPTCQHFLGNRCNKDNCRFAHVLVDHTAQNCEAFGLVGYCEKGADCTELHAHECPYFTNTGSCRYGDNCRNGHVYRASRMRQATRPSPGGVSSPEGTTMQGSNDGDAEAITPGATPDAHEFSQQHDYVAFGA